MNSRVLLRIAWASVLLGLVMEVLLLAAALILGVAALRLVYLAHDCPLDLAPDEAHYWDWSRHLDSSYYSKGPLVAYLLRGGCEVAGSWSMQGLPRRSPIAARRTPALFRSSSPEGRSASSSIAARRQLVTTK